ncbi:hypothetical protein [Microvirga puerhi]|uniref:DUF5666 domain-containing protein n=1 Tax=Microvirga puerhi TaxID=2876078 RepID=A0ABS7VTB3_9HYPH|nr:hypothetical protein [Microvirga puerhi]MBZ6078217.1 hypothetical protein [Microvirga puerhi]
MITQVLPRVHTLVLVLGIAGAVVAPSVWAQGSPPVRVRGTIERIEGDTMEVKTRGGADATLRLAGDARITGLIKASWADIKPGTFVGTAAIEQATGNARSLEVQVFPENMRGVGEGSHEYDLGPKSSMTNGTIGQVTEASTGRQLTIKYQGTEKTVVVPPDAPIVTYVQATRDDLAPGAKVIVTASKQPDGTMQATRILVGKDGIEPPM